MTIVVNIGIVDKSVVDKWKNVDFDKGGDDIAPLACIRPSNENDSIENNTKERSISAIDETNYSPTKTTYDDSSSNAHLIALVSKFLELKKVKPASDKPVVPNAMLKDPPELILHLSNDAKKPSGPRLSKEINYKTPPKTAFVEELQNQDFGSVGNIPFEKERCPSMS